MNACDCDWSGADSLSSRPPLMRGVLDLLGVDKPGVDKPGNGLSRVVHSFHQAGLGWAVSSWVGTGRNVSISAAELRRGLGDGNVRQLAELSGMSADGAAQILAELVPPVIDHLTPEGWVPDTAQLAKSVEIIKRALGV